LLLTFSPCSFVSDKEFDYNLKLDKTIIIDTPENEKISDSHVLTNAGDIAILKNEINMLKKTVKQNRIVLSAIVFGVTMVALFFFKNYYGNKKVEL